MARTQVSLVLVLVALAASHTASAGPGDPPAAAPPAPAMSRETPDDVEPPAPAANTSPDETAAATARRITLRGNCLARTARLATALSIGAPRLSPDERVAGYAMLARCARRDKAWQTLLVAENYLLAHAPDKASADDAVQAYLAIGDERAATDLFKDLAKRFPAQRANLTIAASLIACHKNELQRCFTASGKMLDVLAREPAAPRKAVGENLMFHAFTAAALGNYSVYEADIKRIDALLAEKIDPDRQPLLDNLKTIVAQARASKLFVDVDHAEALAIGTYHLVAGGKIKNTLDNADALVTVRLVNQDRALRTVTVSVEIPGITDVATETIALPPGKQIDRRMSPPLKIGFKVAKLRAARASQIALHIVDPATHAAVLDRTLAIQVLPRDSLPLRRRVGEQLIPTFSYAAAWVTPNAPEVDAFLARAKARIPGGVSFGGEHTATLPQVKALFDELKARGVTYVVDPALFDEHGQIQRTRLPVEVLASSNAQCLEGTLLYATLLEAIGLKPVLVFVPGHAFLAWRPSKLDQTREPLLFLETTLTGGAATFEQAIASARRTHDQAVEDKLFARGIAAKLDIAALRAQGYTPQPF